MVRKGVIYMAARRSDSGRRQAYGRRKNADSQGYIHGNVVAKPEFDPVYHERSPERPKKTSNRVRKNRRQALNIDSAYVIFLSVAAIMALIVCVSYVKLQSRITSRSKNIAVMQRELAELREKNTTEYNAVMDSVNLDEIRERAQNELGMVYASPDQIIEYEDPATDYVKKYEEIPEDGVLARSGKNN